MRFYHSLIGVIHDATDTEAGRRFDVFGPLCGETTNAKGKEENDAGRTLRTDGNSPSDDMPMGKRRSLPGQRTSVSAHRRLTNQALASFGRPEKIIPKKFHQTAQSPVDKFAPFGTITSVTLPVRKNAPTIRTPGMTGLHWRSVTTCQ